ncbi:interferon-inducible GTPase 5-like, partial [Paramuricea clavata]
MGQSQTKQVKQPTQEVKQTTQEVKQTTQKDGKLRFAVAGESGAGKSAFINAIRGLKDDDDGAARVDVLETTMEPTEYQHPENPMISFVDLPGYGTPNNPDLPTYWKNAGLDDYDIFLIITPTRFRQNDFDLAKKIHSTGKSFFVIRTKIDFIKWEIRKRSFNEEKTWMKIREDCMENVKGLISSENEIFLISNYDPHKWDFPRLHGAIINALPGHQRECLSRRKTWSLR